MIRSARARCSVSWVAISDVRKEGGAGRDRGVDRDVGVDAGVEELLPQEDGLPVLADDDGDDGRGRLGPVGELARVDYHEAMSRKPRRR